ncbi:MAG: hypothetical protein JXA18_17505, partial [Chitinispirillaceae bacterium]|nr:hypothetical protein [Chitinispirillaceae bacterium]
GIAVFDLSDPEHPAPIDSFPFTLYSFPITAYGIAVRDTNIFAAVGERGLQILGNTAPSRCISPPIQQEKVISITALPDGMVRLRFSGDIAGSVSIGIYAANGARILKRQSIPVGNAAVTFSCKGIGNKPLKRGVYLIRVKTDKGTSAIEKTVVRVR